MISKMIVSSCYIIYFLIVTVKIKTKTIKLSHIHLLKSEFTEQSWAPSASTPSCLLSGPGVLDSEVGAIGGVF
jgi:hypothetical protein